MALRSTVRNEFRKNASETNEDKIMALKANAVRALSNYLLAVSASKDSQLSQSTKDFHGRSVSQAQQQQQLLLQSKNRQKVDNNSSAASDDNGSGNSTYRDR
jgi:hypothetical protein